MSDDRHPPSFPSVGGSGSSTETDTTLFTSAEPFAEAERPAVEAAEGAPAQPVSSRGVGGRYRWAVAAVATIAVVGIVGALFLFTGPRPGTPSPVAHFAPADVTTYVEVRLDLPGDQRDRLAEFMSHFPGFADQASFERKLDETFNSMLRSSGSGLDWARDIEPWLDGQLAIFSSEPLETDSITTPPKVSIVAMVTDRAALEALISQKMGDTTTIDEEYNGIVVRTVDEDPGPGGSFAITDEAVVLALSSDEVKAALDARADRAPALADDDFFLAQLGSLHTDRLATMYFEHDPTLSSDPLDAPSGLPIDLPMGCASELSSAGAVRAVAEVRAEGDRMTLTARARPSGTDGLPLPPNEPSVLSASMPSDTLAYFEMRQLGASISHRLGRLIDCISGTEGGPDLGRLEQFLGTAPESYFDFVDDAAVAVSFTDGEPTGGMIATVDDETVARTRLERLLTTIRALAGLGDGITVAEQEHGGARLTVVTLEGGLSPGGQESTSLAITVANGRLYIGLGDFVVQALDRTATDSLGSSAKFHAALSAGGGISAGIGYLDLARVRSLIEAEIDPGDRPTYETDSRPFIEPLSHLAFIGRTENDLIVSNVFLYVE